MCPLAVCPGVGSLIPSFSCGQALKLGRMLLADLLHISDRQSCQWGAISGAPQQPTLARPCMSAQHLTASVTAARKHGRPCKRHPYQGS